MTGAFHEADDGADLDVPRTVGHRRSVEPEHPTGDHERSDAVWVVEGRHRPRSPDGAHGMILRIGSSNTSVAPSSISWGISMLMPPLGTTDSTA